MVLRVYGTTRAIHPYDAESETCTAALPPAPGMRQHVDKGVDFVLTSCGFGVPMYEFFGYRNSLERWVAVPGDKVLKERWAKYNRRSLDRTPTGVLTAPR